MATPLVVGGAGCSIQRIVSILHRTDSAGQFHGNWSQLARNLETPGERTEKLRRDQLVDKLTVYDSLNNVIEEWVARRGSAAQLGVLVSALDQIKMTNCSDNLRLEYNLPCRGAEECPSTKWADVPPAFQQKAKETAKKLFPSINVQDTLSKLEGTTLVRLMTGERPQLFKGTLPAPLSYYVNRTLLTRNLITAKIFESNTVDIFLFTGFERHELSGQLKVMTGTSTEKLYGNTNARFLILDNIRHFDKFPDSPDRPVHYLHRETNGKLRWVKSKGTVSVIQEYVAESQDVLQEDELIESLFLNRIRNHPICISDSPGMGKSVLLAQIGRRLLQKEADKIVIFVEIRELVQRMKKHTEPTSEVIEKALQHLVCENELGGAVLKSNYVSDSDEPKLIELLLDGFDELTSSEMKLGYEILNTIQTAFKSIRLWVTSRSHICHELENKLHVLGYNIQPFSPDNQIHFFTSYWSNDKPQLDHYKLKEFAIESLKNVTCTMKSEDSDIAGIPLQCLLIGEVFADEATDYSLTDSTLSFPNQVVIHSITELYQRLIEKKIQKYESLHKGPPNGSDKLTSAELSDMHTLLSLYLLFPENSAFLEDVLGPVNVDEILKVGILERRGDDPSRFIHRTFAEYFAARFAVDGLGGELLWDGELADFLLQGIFICDHIYIKLFSTGVEVISYKYVHDVITYFINSLMKKLDVITPTGNSLMLRSPESKDHSQSLLKIAYACVQHDFPHIFHLFINGQAFEENGHTIFDSNFLLLAIQKSNFLAQSTLLQLEKYGTLDLGIQSKALREAVRKADFSTVEFLLKSEQMRRISEDVSHTTSFPLLHYCVEDSRKDSPTQIEQRIQIIKTLLQINPLLLEVTHFDCTPLIWKQIHIRLLLELVRLGANVFAQDKNKNTLLHMNWHRAHLKTEDYHSLMMEIPEEKLEILLNQKDSNGQTPMQYPTLRSNPAFDKLKLPDEDFITSQGKLLAAAIGQGIKADAFRNLIELGGIVPWKGENSISLLHLAAVFGNVDAVKVLVDEMGMDVNVAADDGSTPLVYALLGTDAIGKRFETAVALVGRGGEFRETTKISNGETFLHIAAKMHNSPNISFLIHLGVIDVNSRDTDGNTPLHLAMREHWKIKIMFFYIAKFLLDNGADPKATNKFGETPVQWAQKNSDMDHKTINLLLFATKVDPEDCFQFVSPPEDYIDERYQSLTQIWAFRILSDNLKTIFGLNQNVETYPSLDRHINDCIERKYTLLHYIATSECSENGMKMIPYLLENGVLDYKAKDHQNRTFLHHFITISKPTPTQFHSLVQYFSDDFKSSDFFQLFNIPAGDSRTTPLLEAVFKVEIEKQTLLILASNGVDLTVVDVDGNTVLTYAIWGKRSKLFMRMLSIIYYTLSRIASGISREVVARDFELDLELASLDDNFYNVVKMNDDSGIADVNDMWKHTNLSTLLHIAIMDEDVKSVEFLAKKPGVDINSHENYQQYTPLHRAALTKNTDTALRLIYCLLNNGADAHSKDRRGCTFLDLFITSSNPKPSPSELHSLIQYLLEKQHLSIFNINGGPRWFQIHPLSHTFPECEETSPCPNAEKEKGISPEELERREYISWGPLSSELISDYRAVLLKSNGSANIPHSTPLEKAVYTVELEEETMALLYSSGVLTGVIPRLLNSARLGGRSEEFIFTLGRFGFGPNHKTRHLFL